MTLSRLQLYEDALRKVGIEPSTIGGSETESGHGVASPGIATTSTRVTDPKVDQSPAQETSENSKLGHGSLVAKGGKSLYLAKFVCRLDLVGYS